MATGREFVTLLPITRESRAKVVRFIMIGSQVRLLADYGQFTKKKKKKTIFAQTILIYS